MKLRKLLDLSRNREKHVAFYNYRLVGKYSWFSVKLTDTCLSTTGTSCPEDSFKIVIAILTFVMYLKFCLFLTVDFCWTFKKGWNFVPAHDYLLMAMFWGIWFLKIHDRQRDTQLRDKCWSYNSLGPLETTSNGITTWRLSI